MRERSPEKVVHTPTSRYPPPPTRYPYETRDRGVLANQPAYFHALRYLIYYTTTFDTRTSFSFRTFYRRFNKFAFDTRSFGLIHCCPRLRTRRHTRDVARGDVLGIVHRRCMGCNGGKERSLAAEIKWKFRFSANTKKKNSARMAYGNAARPLNSGRASVTDSCHTTDKCSSRRRTTRSPSGTPTHTRTTTHREYTRE